MLVDCDRDGCPETGIIPWPFESRDEPNQDTIVRLCHENGWYATPRGLFCYRHKPRDWDAPDVALPPELTKGVSS